ncbi:MAG TPA: GNAT family N-acetyltransferase [Thermoanaerobaculia bacterium]
MLRTATRDDLPRLRELFARANDAPYDLAAVAEEKCFGPGPSGAPVVRVFGDFEGAAVTCGRYLRVLAVDRERRGRGIGTALLEDSPAAVIAAEPGNYFTPGVSDGGFFGKRGFRAGAQTWNLHVDPAVAPPPWRASLTAARHRDDVLAFVEREFGRIWRFEAASALRLFSIDHDGELAGFAAIEANNRGLGTFGPTGVAKHLRGRGLGRELLLQALAGLAELGYRRAVIPWTDALEFYRKSCGAEPAHQFTTFSK